MPTTPPGYTPPPADLPQRGDRATFSSRVDAWVTWFSTVILTQLAAMIANAYTNAVDAFNSATAAAASAAASLTSANNSAASAIAATVTANAVPWVSGTTYALNASVISQINFATYRRKTAAGSGTTDPSLDPTNYVLLSLGALPAMKVSQRLSTGTTGGTIPGFVGPGSATVTRIFNTTDYNDIPGASLSGNTVILPAGTYEIEASAPYDSAARQMLYLYNVTDSSATLSGGSSNSAENPQRNGEVSGRFVITAQKTFELRQYLLTGSSLGSGPALGGPTNLTGFSETYSQLNVTKVK